MGIVNGDRAPKQYSLAPSVLRLEQAVRRSGYNQPRVPRQILSVASLYFACSVAHPSASTGVDTVTGRERRGVVLQHASLHLPLGLYGTPIASKGIQRYGEVPANGPTEFEECETCHDNTIQIAGDETTERMIMCPSFSGSIMAAT